MLGRGHKVGQRSKIPRSLLFISLPIPPCKASSNGSLKAPPDCSPSDTFQAAAAGVTDVTEQLSRPPLQEYGSQIPHCRRCGNPSCFPTSVGPCWPMLAHVGPCWPMLAHVGPCWPMLAHVGPCWPMLAHVGPCWPMLAHVGPCWPMLAHVGPVDFRHVSSERDSASPCLRQKQDETSVPTTSH